MAKVISLSNEVFSKLKKRKNSRSYSETILDLMEKPKKRTLMDVLNDLGPDYELADNIEKAYKERKNFKFREVEL